MYHLNSSFMKKYLLLVIMLLCTAIGYVEAQISTARLILNTDCKHEQPSQYCTGLQHASMEIEVWNSFNTTKAMFLSFKLTAPNGKMISTKSSTMNYTSRLSAKLAPGKNRVALPSLAEAETSLFTEGTYKYEIGCDGEVLCQGDIIVEKQAKNDTPTVVINAPQEPQQKEVAVNSNNEPENKPFTVQPQQPTVTEEKPQVSVSPAANPTDNGTIQPVQGKEPVEPMKFHFGITGGIVKPSTSVTANGPLSSVIDYGLTCIPELDTKETPNYEFGLGYSAGLFVQIPLIKGKNVFLEAGAQYAHFSYTNEFANKEDVEITDSSNGIYCLIDYANKETYSMNYVNIPVLVGYEFGISPLFRIDVKTGPVVGILASAKLNCDGHSNVEIYTNNDEYYGYANSTTSGSANLLTGAYDFDQHFSTGDGTTYNIKGEAAAAPYKAINASWRIGAGIGVGPVSIDVNYDLGLMNVANAQYWENAQGGRIPGLLYFGDFLPSTAPIKDYVQKFSNLSASISVRF